MIILSSFIISEDGLQVTTVLQGVSVCVDVCVCVVIGRW